MHELLNRLSFLAPIFYGLLGATILASIATAYLRRKRCRSAALGESESLDDKKTRRSFFFFSNARNFSFIRAFCWITGVGIAIMIGAVVFIFLYGSSKNTVAVVDPCTVCKVERIPIEGLTCKKVKEKLWRFFGNKCVGSGGCGACKAVCESDDIDTPPLDKDCNRCSVNGE